MSDIFISHSRADNKAAKEFVNRLKEKNFDTFFLDFDPEKGIKAGDKWEQKLYEKLRDCQVVIVLCSPHSMDSKWCFAEISHARSLGKVIFPVVIQSCNFPAILRDTQVLDLTKGTNYERIYNDLNNILKKVFKWNENQNPYLGFRAFKEKDAALFFGRSKDIKEGINSLKVIRNRDAQRMLLFLGVSGSGKSSLVAAGLIPELKQDPENWIVVDPFRQNELLGDPFYNLAVVLSSAFKRYESNKDIEEIYKQLCKRLIVSVFTAAHINATLSPSLITRGV